MKARALAWLPSVLPALAGVASILVLGPLILWMLGADVWTVAGEAVESTLLSGYGLFQVLFKATPLMLCGLAVALPLGAGLFNVGGEGQALLGGLACAAAAHAARGAGDAAAFVLGLLAAVLAGGVAGAVPGALRHLRGIHEVIGTIMLNFILAALCGWLLSAALEDPGTAHSPELAAGVLFSRLSTLVPAAAGSSASTSLLLAVVLAGALQWVVARTVFGFELRASGAGPLAARHAGISAGRMVVGSLALGGALAGLAGAHFVLGARRFFEEGLVGGDGFLGIAVALMARSAPAAVVPAALLFAALSQAGLSLGAANVPREVVLVLQGVVVLVLGGTTAASERLGRSLASRRAAVPAPPAVKTPGAVEGGADA